MMDSFRSFERIFATIGKSQNLCLKHLQERLKSYESYPDRKYEPCFRLVVDNEDCFACREAAESAYYSKLMELRK